MRSLLEMYIRMLMEEAVPDAGEEDEAGDGDDVDESSGCGGIAGYTLPLGASKDDFANPPPQRAKKR